MHVADGIDVHHQRDEGDHRHHQSRQVVDQETDLEAHAIADTPGIHRHVGVAEIASHHLPQHPGREQEGHADTRDGDDMGRRAWDEAHAEASHQRREERRQDDDE